MADKQRLDFLAELFKECPTATVTHDNDTGFIVEVEGVCDPVRITAPTFRKAIDKLKREVSRQDALEPTI